MSALKSRKTKLMLAGILGIVAAALSGEITWIQAVAAGVPLIMSNILGIAIEDAGEKSGGAK